MFKQLYIKDVFGKSPVLYTFSLGDDLCVDVMDKKLVVLNMKPRVSHNAPPRQVKGPKFLFPS